MRGIYAAVVSLALAGCTLIYASDLDDARQAGAQPDGAASVANEAGVVATEAGTHDGGTTTNPPSGCASISPTPKFCDDFDSETTIGDGFDDVNTGAGQTVFDLANFVSAPRSAKVTFSSKQDCGYSRLEKSFDDVGTNQVSVHFRVRPSAPWSGQILFVTGLATTGTDGCEFLLYANDDDGSGTITSMSANIQKSSNQNDVRKLEGLTAVDAWTAVDIVETKLASGGVHYHIALTVDGQAPIVDEIDATECPAWVGADIDVGIHCGQGKATVNYDDVWVDWN